MDKGAKAGLIILVCGILGMLTAFIEQEAYNSGYLLDLYLTDASQLPGLMVVTIILWLLIGCIIAAVTQG